MWTDVPQVVFDRPDGGRAPREGTRRTLPRRVPRGAERQGGPPRPGTVQTAAEGVHQQVLPAHGQHVPVEVEEFEPEVGRYVEHAHAHVPAPLLVGGESRQHVGEHVAVLRHGDRHTGRIGQELLGRRPAPATAARGQEVEVPATHRVSEAADGHHLRPDLLLVLLIFSSRCSLFVSVDWRRGCGAADLPVSRVCRPTRLPSRSAARWTGTSNRHSSGPGAPRNEASTSRPYRVVRAAPVATRVSPSAISR